ncbi:MAG TPA: hypothetical protein IAC41_01415 [Candidatus Merdenecus merdavium]|nr:hypothetical protein [Candidatus Merdenecus merdavium]
MHDCKNNPVKKRMSKQDKIDWDNLYEYVKNNVLHYSSKQSLSVQMVLRLKGMLNGKFYANNTTTDMADYSYKTVLNTFKFCSPKIQSVLSSKNFDSENRKFNYICAIVEGSLNDVFLRMENAAKVQQKTERMDVSAITHNGAGYQSKTRETSNKLNDLW